MGSATGIYCHSIDAKGRLFIPAQLRRVLGESIHLGMGTEKCLIIYSQKTWDALTEKFEALPISTTGNMRKFFGNAAECEADGQGRIVVPQKLRQYAGLQKDAVIVGMHNRAEIWSAETWEKENEGEATPEEMRELMASLGI